MKSHRTLALAGILFVAFVLRMSFLELMEYKADEAIAMDLMKANLGDAWQLVGLQSSIGLMNPPMFIYLLSLPGLLSRSPVFVTGFVALANICGLAALYFFAKKHFGTAAALWSTALLTTSPWHVVYSRKLWAQDLLFPFMMLFLFALFSYAERQTKNKTCLIALCLAVLTQLHMSAWFFFLTFVVLVIFYGRRNTLSHLILGAIVLCVTYIPYFAFHVQDGFVNLGTLANRASENTSALQQHVEWLAYTSTGVGFEYLLGTGYADFVAAPFIKLATYILYAGSIAYVCAISVWVGVLVAKIMRRKRWSHAEWLSGVFLLFIVCQLLFYAILRIPAYPHYAIIFYPMPTLLLVTCLPFLHNRIAKTAGLSLLMLLLCAQLTFTSAFLYFVHNHHETINGDYGTPYLFQRQQT